MILLHTSFTQCGKQFSIKVVGSFKSFSFVWSGVCTENFYMLKRVSHLRHTNNTGMMKVITRVRTEYFNICELLIGKRIREQKYECET